jgi:hypothetical protein
MGGACGAHGGRRGAYRVLVERPEGKGPLVGPRRRCEDNIQYNITIDSNWIGYILRRNCLLKQVIVGKIKEEMEVTRRRGRRRKKLLDDLKDRGGYSHLKEEALDRTIWRNRFGRDFGPVVIQNTEHINVPEVE